MTGFLPIEQIHELQQEAAIIACPSIWHDPMPKAVLEALAAGSALLTTRRGGIPEVAEGRAHIVDMPDVESFAAALRKLITDGSYRKALQQSAWQDFPFTSKRMAADADAIRAEALSVSTAEFPAL
jgi:glycosyltransferase involved in cell wall biosynthesis